MAEDDAGSGWVLSRREVLALLGAAGTGAFLVAPDRGHAQIPSFVVAPELDEDPSFVDERLNRSGIRSGTADRTLRPGWPMRLTLRGSQLTAAGACAPLGGRGANFSTQLYFEDALIDRVHARAPYALHGRRDTPNDQDEVFVSGGLQQIVRVTEGPTALSGTFELAIKRA